LTDVFEYYGVYLSEESNDTDPESFYVPSSVEDLAEMLGRLEDYELNSDPMSETVISDLFEDLSELYEDIGINAMDTGKEEDENLPVMLQDLADVYNHVSNKDSSLDELDNLFEELNGRHGKESATPEDLTVLFDKLSQHYDEEEGDFMELNDLHKNDDEILVNMFNNLADYYANGEGEDSNPDADQLWMIYDELSSTFEKSSEQVHHTSKHGDHTVKPVDNKGSHTNTRPSYTPKQKTIYTKDFADVEAMYKLIMEGQSIEE